MITKCVDVLYFCGFSGVVKGDLDINGWGCDLCLPDNITIIGDLDIGQTGITKLPTGLRVLGCLNLFLSEVDTLPDDIMVNGTVDIRFSPLGTHHFDCPSGVDVRSVIGFKH